MRVLIPARRPISMVARALPVVQKFHPGEGNAMADDLFAGGIGFLGEDVDLYVEADEVFAPDVLVTFQGTHQGTNSTSTTLTFNERLTARPSPLRDPKKAKGKVATRIRW